MFILKYFSYTGELFPGFDNTIQNLIRSGKFTDQYEFMYAYNIIYELIDTMQINLDKRFDLDKRLKCLFYNIVLFIKKVTLANTSNILMILNYIF